MVTPPILTMRCCYPHHRHRNSEGSREHIKRQRNSSVLCTATKKAPIFQFKGRSDGDPTDLGDVVRLTADLKKIIIEQGNIIKSVKADLMEIKSEQETLKD